MIDASRSMSTSDIKPDANWIRRNNGLKNRLGAVYEAGMYNVD